MTAATLELHVLSYAGSEASTGSAVRIGHSPVSIGRSPACHLALEDPERLISRSHLAAWLDGHGKAWVRNASGTTPVFIEGQELPPGAQTALRAGQTLVLGRYLLGVRTALAELHAASAPAFPAAGNPAEGAATIGAASTFAPIPEEFDVFAAPQAPRSASGGSDTGCGLAEFSGEAAALSEVFENLPDFDARGPSQAPEVLDLVRAGSRAGSGPARGHFVDPLAGLLGGSGQLLDFASSDESAIAGSISEGGGEVDGLFRMPVTASAEPPASAQGIGLGAGGEPPAAQTVAASSAGSLDPLALDLGALGAGDAGDGQSLLDLIGEPGEPAAAMVNAPTPARLPGQGAALSGGLPAPIQPPPRAEHPVNGRTAGPRPRAQPDLPAPRVPAQSAQVVAAPSNTRAEAQDARSTAQSAAAQSAEGRTAERSAQAADTKPPHRHGAAALRRSSAPADALSAAFARGCGLDPDQLGSLDEGSLETLGRLFQSLVAGTLQLIHARSSTKDELRAHMTMIATSGNNPLKFAPDAQAAMLQLVGRGLPGFMPPVEAVRDAFADLSAHQVGLLAASRSAMYAMAGRLSPEHIQQRVGGPRGFSGLLPSAHKAQLWDAFVAAHTQLLGEAREEFDAAFQGAFVDAYEGEVRRVQSGGAA